MKGYKAFEKGLICKGKQYAENTVFKEDKAEICECGMHFCENPLDTLNYYPLLDENNELIEFAEVEALDEPKTDDNKKYCTKELKIGLKLSFAEFIKASVDFLFKSNETASSGDNAQLASSGYNAQLASSGNYAQLASSGYNAQLASSGYNAQLASSGDNSIVAGIGINNIAKGKKGNWLVLAEWVYDAVKEEYIPKTVKSKKIDGKALKENTFYKLENGKFVEVE